MCRVSLPPFLRELSAPFIPSTDAVRRTAHAVNEVWDTYAPVLAFAAPVAAVGWDTYAQVFRGQEGYKITCNYGWIPFFVALAKMQLEKDVKALQQWWKGASRSP